MLLINTIGNLGKDPEVKKIGNGNCVTFSIGVKIGKDQTQWVNVTANEFTVKGVLDYLKKGQGVFVSGDGKLREYAKNDGTKGFSLDIWASKVQLVGGAKREQSDAPTTTTHTNAEDDSVPF